MSIFKHFKYYVREKNYRKYQKKAKDLVLKELDLMNFIKKSRMLALATFSLLNTKQRIYVSQSGRTLNAHDNINVESSSDQLSDHENIRGELAGIFSKSRDKVDQRLSKLYQI